MNQDLIQKNYYEQLMVGHYIDVKYSENQWKIAKIIEKDKRYALVQFEGINTRQEQVYLNGYKVAPLRTNTEGYTGSIYKTYRPQLPPISQYKNHLEILQQNYFKQSLPSAFTATQYLRGELFVLVHSLLTREDLKEDQANEAMQFLVGFTQFVIKLAKRIKKLASQYFQAIGPNKMLYLTNQKVGIVHCINELLILLNYIIKAQSSKQVVLFKCKGMDQQKIIRFFLDMRDQYIFIDLFFLNDGNGKWLPINIHKRIYWLVKKYVPKFNLPEYKLKDYQEIFQIYPFVIKEEQKNNCLEQKYVAFIIACLKEQTSFQAKLKALQELRKIIEGDVKFYQVDQKKVFSMISQQGVIDHMLNEYHFNPQIFKRFTPILQNYCKVKSLSAKNVSSLFKLASTRHQSQVTIIFEIICTLAQFIQIDALDGMYSEILKCNLNSDKTISLLKNFTIKAITNYSKQKSFLSTFFKKAKNSSKYGNYALDLFFKELQDDGIILKEMYSLVFDTIKEIFTLELFQTERANYLGTCIGWMQKGKNYGQAVRLIDYIISTYPTSTFFGENKKDLLEKLITKNNLVQLVIFGSKNKQKNYVPKLAFSQFTKYIYDFLESYYDYLYRTITIEHVEYLWLISDSKLLSSFLKKPKIVEPKKKDQKEKYIKKLEQNVQDDILNKLIRKQNFFERQLTIEEFEALDQIFISYNLLKKKIEISELGTLRYLTPDMEGSLFYFEFAAKMWGSQHIQRIIRKTINLFLRPKEEGQIQVKIMTWKICLLKLVEKLKTHPQICLKATSIFFQMIQGKLSKPNVTAQGNIDVYVSFDGQEKVITLPKNNTIFRLRKQIMIQFNLNGDFAMHSLSMKRDISFVEEQDYSLNALSTTQAQKGPLIDVVNKKKEKHPQMLAVQKFKELIQKEQNLYSTLFGLNFQNITELFWKTIELLPVNRQLIKKIQNCANFSIKQWRKLIMNEAVESLQYHLNIIHEILQKNNKWVSLFYSSGGFLVIMEILEKYLKGQAIYQRIINRCMLIIIKVMETVNQIQDKLLQELKLILIAKVIIIFKGEIADVIIPIDSLNLIFQLLNLTNKLYKDANIQIELDIVLKILEYGIFKPTNKLTNQFIKQDFQHYLINHFNTQKQKLAIYKHLLAFLNLEQLVKRQHSELLFIFLIDFMNTFVEKEDQLVQNPIYLSLIQSFVMQVLKSSLEDDSKQKYNHIISGTFKLLLFTIKYPTQTFNYRQIFDILLRKFLLNKQTKRVKHQATIKALYQCLKKLLFTDQSLIQLLIEEVAPMLRQNGWRRNTFMSWSLQAKRQQRSIFSGLENLGATCYINCLIQQLFMIAHFRQNFLAIQSRNYRQSLQANEIYQFQSIFSGLKYSNKRSFNTRKFCQSFITYQGVSINPMIQSDADEFFSQLMEKIQFFLKQNQRHDIIENTFQGKLSNQLNCQGCPHNSEKQENFMSIGVNIRGKKTLEQALQGYVEGEILDGDNAYFCELCQKKVRTQKRLCIKQLPNILIIVLKRFEFNYDQMRKIKINTYLNFPMQLNMKKFTSDFLGGAKNIPDEPFDYFLRGTVIHSGTSEGGHYYSFINSKDKWYCFNDQFIEQINIKRVEEDGFGGDDKTFQGDFKFQKYKNAYMLLYEKCNPPPQYHRQESQIVTQFSQQMQKTIIVQNNNSDFLSVMLDSNFNRLGQNFSALQSQEAYKFTLLYFHTVVLRDKNKQEYIPNYYRILQGLLLQQQISFWYLSQINHQFLKQFLIESPRTVRFVCTSLILFALKKVDKVPENFLGHALFSLKKNAMTPFAKIFKVLSDRPELQSKMIECEFPQRVVSYLMQKANQNFKMIEIQSLESFFGRDSSEKQKQRQFCASALCQSLINFDLPYADILQIFQKYHTRNGSKALAQMLSQKTTEEHLSNLLISLESNIIKEGEFKRQEVEKYMFLVRYLCLIEEQQKSDWRSDKCIYSLKKLIYEFRTCYEPMQTLLRQINYIAARSKKFTKKLKIAILEKENIYDVVKTLKYWLKEAEHPQHLPKSDEFKRKISPVSYEQKYQIEAQNKSLLEKRLYWIIQKEVNEVEVYESDIQNEQINRQVLIRNKRFKIKQHLGLIKKIDVEGNQRWGMLQKADIDICMGL